MAARYRYNEIQNTKILIIKKLQMYYQYYRWGVERRRYIHGYQ